MADNRRFAKRSAVYTCGMCGRRTRETGFGESEVELCAKCYATANVDNMESDGGYSAEEISDLRAQIEAGDYNV